MASRLVDFFSQASEVSQVAPPGQGGRGGRGGGTVKVLVGY